SRYAAGIVKDAAAAQDPGLEEVADIADIILQIHADALFPGTDIAQMAFGCFTLAGLGQVDRRLTLAALFTLHLDSPLQRTIRLVSMFLKMIIRTRSLIS